jgi:hypothetical protein
MQVDKLGGPRAIHRNEFAWAKLPPCPTTSSPPSASATESACRPNTPEADELGERGAAERQRAQRRIEVDVGGVDESERHERMER